MAARKNHDIIGGSKRFQSEAAEAGGVCGGREGGRAADPGRRHRRHLFYLFFR
jgi:hypothetical protein